MNDKFVKRKKPLDKKIVALFILVFVFVLAIIYGREMQLWKKTTLTDITPFEKSEIIVCFSKNMHKLEQKTLEAKKGIPDKEKARIIIRELKKEGAIPENTVLHDFMPDTEGTLYLNLSKNISEDKQDSAKEIMTVYSIVNSFLLTFKDARKVQLLIEGQPVYTLNGTIYTYKPFEFNKHIMED